MSGVTTRLRWRRGRAWATMDDMTVGVALLALVLLGMLAVALVMTVLVIVRNRQPPTA